MFYGDRTANAHQWSLCTHSLSCRRCSDAPLCSAGEAFLKIKVKKMEREYIIITDGFWESVGADTYMFFVFFSVLALNHFILDDSTFGSWFMGILLFLTIINRGTSRAKRMTFEELKRYVEEKK